MRVNRTTDQRDMLTSNHVPLAAIALLIAGSAALVGCHDPEFKIRQARRDQRIRELIDTAETNEQHRRARIDWLFETDARMNEWRTGHLQSTVDSFEYIETQRRRNWEQAPPSESILIRRMIEGQPDQIPSVWARMVY
jgi:hypothetical protein